MDQQDSTDKGLEQRVFCDRLGRDGRVMVVRDRSRVVCDYVSDNLWGNFLGYSGPVCKKAPGLRKPRCPFCV